MGNIPSLSVASLRGYFMKKQLRLIFLIVLVCWRMLPASGQNAFASEEELKTQATKLFDDDQFEDAYPLYSQLVSLYPKDPNYNYRLGVCMLYASDDKEKPISYLEYAAKRPEIEKEVFFYLARAYHLNYRFDDAIKEYEAYKKVASSAKAEKLMVDRQIEMCKNGKKLLRNITDLVVIDKKEMSRSDFFRSYDISDIGGKLLVKPDEPAFKTALDKKKKENSIIYLASNNNQIFFSSYGDDPDQGKDIFVIRKLPNGEWSKPQTLGYPVNTEYDEDYPFLHPNGKVLYFCSKGHNSMGGYDIFKTTLNEETNTWNKPVNMDFPINTPDDDILYVTNEDEKEAFFSSARNSVTGKTAVFHINVERKPIDIAIIKGTVIKNREGQAVDARITVKDLGDNSMLGIYNAKAETGGYLINLPNGGKFMFTVEATGFKTQSDVVELPTQYEFKPLKQEISYELGTDKLIIKNLFDEPVDDASYMLALNFIKERSKMEVGTNPQDNSVAANQTANSSENDDTLESVDNTEQSTVTNQNTNASLSNDQIVKIAYDDADDAQKEADDLQEQANIALNMANEKAELAQNKSREATQLQNDAGKMEDAAKKQAAKEEADQATRDADLLSQETVAAFNLAKKLGLKAESKKEEADLSMQYAKDLDAAVKMKNPADAMAKLEAQEKKLEELNKKNGAAEPDNIVAGLKLDEQNKKKALDQATQDRDDTQQEIKDNETLIASLEADAEKTKKADLKQGILDQIAGLKEDNIEKQKELADNQFAVDKAQKEYDGVINEMAMVDHVVEKSKTGTNQEAAASVAGIDPTKLEQQVSEIKTANDKRIADNPELASSAKSNSIVDAANKTEQNQTSNPETNASATNSKNESATQENSVDQNSGNVLQQQPAIATAADINEKYSSPLATISEQANPLEKERQKTSLYSDWLNSIDSAIVANKNATKMEKDKTRKKELAAELTQLESAKKEKQQALKDATAEENRLSALAAKNPANASSDIVTSASGVDNETNSDNTETVHVEQANRMYSEQINNADQLSDPVKRNEAKQTALQNWNSTLQSDIQKKQEELANTTDPEMQALLNAKIKSEQDKLAENNSALATLNSASLASANTEQTSGNKQTAGTNSNSGLETNTAGSNPDNAATNPNSGLENNATTSNSDVAATNSTAAQSNNNTGSQTIEAANASSEKLNKELDAQLASISTALPVEQQEAQKQAAYAEYVLSATDQLEQQRNMLKSVTDPNQKATLRNNIAGLQLQIDQNKQLLEASKQKTAALSGQSSVENIASTTSNKNGQDGSNDGANTKNVPALNGQQTTDQSTVNETDIAASTNQSDNPSNAVPEVYTNSESATAMKQATDLTSESDQLSEQARLLRVKAAETSDESEKQALLDQSVKIDQQANDKLQISQGFVAKANRTQYQNNSNALSQYAAAVGKNPSDELMQAELLKDEAQTYFSSAQKARDLAASTTDKYDKENALEEAANKESMALEQQQKALTVYQKNNPALVIRAGGNDALAIQSTEAAQSDNSDNAATPDGKGVNENDTAANQATASVNAASANNNTAAENGNDVAVTNKQSQTNGAANSGDQQTGVVDANTTLQNENQGNGNENTNSNDPSQNNGSLPDSSGNFGNSVATTANTNANEATVNPHQNLNLAGDEKFVRSSKPVYSASKPIPVNEKMPEGLVYKVQIGAFRNPISPEVFTGMSPITAETTPQGLTRYTAGLFKKFATADQVKAEIRTLGYRDAFVVAFLNGKRISISEAAAMSGEQSLLNNAGVDQSGTQSTAVKSTATLAQTPGSDQQTAVNESSGSQIAPTNSVETTSGLFFTVQVGVYSQPISAQKLNGLHPLNAEKTATGMLRYSTGIYSSLSRANEARSIVVNGGIRDAFVTAYQNGKRMTAAEASALISAGNVSFVESPILNQLPQFGGAASPVQNDPSSHAVTPETTNAASSTTSSIPPVSNTGAAPEVKSGTTAGSATTDVGQPMTIDSGLVYKVQIGAFKDEVPLAIANKFLKIADKGIKNYKDENGLTIYTVGKYTSYEAAAASKAEIILDSNVIDAFIVAYLDGKKISIDQARKMQSQQ